MLGGFARVQPRSETDADRLRELGCRAGAAPGDLKLAAPPLPVDAAELRRLRPALAGRPVWLAASTHPGRGGADASRPSARSRARHPGLLTVIAPRHPERGAAIAAGPGDYAGRAPRPAASRRRAAGVWIADTLGELGLWYRLAGIAFVGRSLLPPGGGQNPLEPARLGCAIAVGPHTGNFAEHVAMLREAGGLTVVQDAAELAALGRCAAARPGARDRRWRTPQPTRCSATATCPAHRRRPARAAGDAAAA